MQTVNSFLWTHQFSRNIQIIQGMKLSYRLSKSLVLKKFPWRMFHCGIAAAAWIILLSRSGPSLKRSWRSTRASNLERMLRTVWARARKHLLKSRKVHSQTFRLNRQNYHSRKEINGENRYVEEKRGSRGAKEENYWIKENYWVRAINNRNWQEFASNVKESPTWDSE